MLSKSIQESLRGSSVIRRMFIEGQELAARIGAENVQDFSLGNPVAPVPQRFSQALVELVEQEPSLTLHGYTNNAGYPEVRAAVAENLNRRYDAGLTGNEIIMTVGAAGGLNIVLRALLDPGDEVVVFRPYFGEYRGYVTNWGGRVVEVDPVLPGFQPDLEDLARKVGPRTKALIVNNPCNPSGAIYSEQTLRGIAAVLERAQQAYGTEIYMISDEPYREIAYDGRAVPFLTKYYDNTFVAYSFSKSLSIPGERIGYIAVSPTMKDAATVVDAVTVANRICGFVNAPSLLQKAVAACLEETCDVAFYDRNRRLLCDGLKKAGYEFAEPEGTFYLFVKSPVPDEADFIARAKALGVILVAGSAFSWPGYVRIAYCVQPTTIEKAIPKLTQVAKEYGLC